MLVQVYGKPMCDKCEALVSFLESRGIYHEYNNVEYMDFEEISRILMNRRDPNNRTLPILFVDGRELEGNDEITKFFNSATKAVTAGVGPSNLPEKGQNTENGDSNYEPGLGSARSAPKEEG